jgi:hypothetical protein
MFGSVLEKGRGAPVLQTGWPTVSGAGAPTQVLCQPCTSHVEPAGQHVMLLLQHTAFSYGQHPLPFTENLAPHTVPVVQTCGDGGGGGGAGGSGTAVQFASRQPEVDAPGPDLGDGRLPASLVFSEHVTGGAKV